MGTEGQVHSLWLPTGALPAGPLSTLRVSANHSLEHLLLGTVHTHRAAFLATYHRWTAQSTTDPTHLNTCSSARYAS